MSLEETYQRLAVIACELEEHATAAWILERERDELRAKVRLLNRPPTDKAHAA